MAVKSGRVIDKDKGFKAFVKGFIGLEATVVAVGIQGADASQIRDTGLTMVQLGTIHEFGEPKVNIPQRSFLRSTADVNEAKYERFLTNIVARITKAPRGFNTERALLQLGEQVRSDVINRIRSAEIKQDLAESTQRAKARKAAGVVEPALIDEGLLISSIRAVVR